MAHIHPDAQREFDDIMNRGNTTQKVVCAMAWTDVVLASSAGSSNKLTRGAVFSRGPVYYAQHALRSSNLRWTTGEAVAGARASSGRIEVLACDVSASPWWHGPAPQVRAGGRL